MKRIFIPTESYYSGHVCRTRSSDNPWVPPSLIPTLSKRNEKEEILVQESCQDFDGMSSFIMNDLRHDAQQ